MQRHRIERLQEALLQEIRTLLLFELESEFLSKISITHVKLTKDVSVARIYFELNPAFKIKRTEVEGEWERMKGVIRRELAHRMQLRSVPMLEFFYDETSETISQVERLIDSL